jgi:hypothetical protein
MRRLHDTRQLGGRNQRNIFCAPAPDNDDLLIVDNPIQNGRKLIS